MLSRVPHILANLVLLGLVVAMLAAPPVGAEPGNLAPTWKSEISASQSSVEGEQQNLQDAQQELAEAQADGDSSYAESREERVTYYEERLAGAQAQVAAARAGLTKQTELDKAGEPEGQMHEIKESISYYETLRDESQTAGADANVELATDELQGGTFGGGLYEMLEDEKKKQAAKEAAKNALGAGTIGETTEESTAPETTEETTAAPAPGGANGGGGENQPKPEPTPKPAPVSPAPASGPGILSGLFGDVNLVPIGVFAALVIGGIFALSRAGGMSIGQYFSIPKFGAMMGRHKAKTMPKKPSKLKAVATSKPSKPELNLETEEAVEDAPGPTSKPAPEAPEPASKKEKGSGTSAEDLNGLFGLDQEGEDDENPPD